MLRDHRLGVYAMFCLLPALFLLMGTGSRASAQQYRRLIDLRGEWRFEIGDDQRWAARSYNDDGWVKLQVPGQWENQGFPGYDGYAWYRKSFPVPKEWAQKQLYLDLGKIDDVDEVYVNGFFIGFMGQFPPSYMTAYNMQRRYYLPAYCLRPGETNTIAVRVFDSEQAGGITTGNQGIFEDVKPLIVDQSLESTWKFSIGDNMAWRGVQFDDSKWEDVQVPSFWETQGHKGYDGYGWYRKSFRFASESQHFILFLGKIDDDDEVYLNGERIGRTGTMGESGNETHKKWRAYTIPGDKVFLDRENVIAVRVFDGFIHGGIYEGPIGIVRREKYLEWKPYHDRTSEVKNGVQKFLEWLFE